MNDLVTALGGAADVGTLAIVWFIAQMQRDIAHLTNDSDELRDEFKDTKKRVRRLEALARMFRNAG